jgi:16S rRNA (guanine527-N7)-methyltransferase
LSDTDFLDISKQTFLTTCRTHNLTITDQQLEKLDKYVDLLLARNKHLNLISRKDEQNIWTQHILHCTSLLFHRKLPPHANTLDLGTGGGLPGIVFAILHPELHFTLLDATRKKIDAVRSMAGELGIKNVRTVWGRAEAIGKQPEYSGNFDIVVARAVASLEKLVRWAKPFLRYRTAGCEASPELIPRQSLIAFKGGGIQEEIERAVKTGAVKATDIIDIESAQGKKIVIVNLNLN